MGRGIGKSLFGYNTKLVDDEIAYINQQFDEEYKRLAEELKNLQQENESTQQKIDELSVQAISPKDVEAEIGRSLVKAHLESSYTLYSSIKRFKLMEKDKIQVIEKLNGKLRQLDREINKMMDDIQTIAIV